MTSGNFIQSYGYAGMISSTNNVVGTTVTIKNSTVIDEADFVEKYADYGQKTSTNQCIGRNYDSVGLTVIIDNSNLISQYSEPLSIYSKSVLHLKDAYIYKEHGKFAENNWNNAYVELGWTVSDTAGGADIEGILDADNFFVPSVIQDYNEIYVHTDPLYVEIYMLEGAAIRLTNVTGLRFYTYVDIDKIASLRAQGHTVTMGTLIAPADYNTTLTVEYAAEGNALNIPFTSNEYFIEGDFEGVVGTVSNIKERNWGREYIARGYVCVDGKYFYAGQLDGYARSIKQVANMIIDDEELSNYSAEHQSLIQNWAAAEDYVAE